ARTGRERERDLSWFLPSVRPQSPLAFIHSYTSPASTSPSPSPLSPAACCLPLLERRWSPPAAEPEMRAGSAGLIPLSPAQTTTRRRPCRRS
uniref:Uncharacterized protein n=1 Tax=Aegilops tauschii subsp. strangulata TaxID=200361 RepID=A0A453LQE9_AEGTS